MAWRKAEVPERSKHEYEVSDQGGIRSRLKVCKCKSAEPGEWVEKDTSRSKTVSYIAFTIGYKSMHLHRMIADAWIPKPEGMNIVDHINGDALDNRVVNLRWVNKSMNKKNSWNKRPNVVKLEQARHGLAGADASAPPTTSYLLRVGVTEQESFDNPKDAYEAFNAINVCKISFEEFMRQHKNFTERIQISRSYRKRQIWVRPVNERVKVDAAKRGINVGNFVVGIGGRKYKEGYETLAEAIIARDEADKAINPRSHKPMKESEYEKGILEYNLKEYRINNKIPPPQVYYKKRQIWVRPVGTATDCGKFVVVKGSKLQKGFETLEEAMAYRDEIDLIANPIGHKPMKMLEYNKNIKVFDKKEQVTEEWDTRIRSKQKKC